MPSLEYGPLNSVNIAAAGSTRIFVIFKMISSEKTYNAVLQLTNLLPLLPQ